MKKVSPFGEKIKQLRQNSEIKSTQKELAYALRISERMLREIENRSVLTGIDVIDRIASWFDIRRELIIDTGNERVVSSGTVSYIFGPPAQKDKAEELIPRYDYGYAEITSDEVNLFDAASSCHDLTCSIEVSMSDEVAGYARELMELLTALTWDDPDHRLDRSVIEQIDYRRRVKRLIILLRGHDIGIYQTRHLRHLPERFEPLPKGESSNLKNRLVIVLASRGNYSEDTIKVQIDHGQPFILESRLPF